MVFPGSRFREIDWRECMRFESGWRGVPFKHSRLRVLAIPDPSDPCPHQSAFQAHFWPDTNTHNANPDGILLFNNTQGVNDAGNVADRGNNTGTSIWRPRTPGRTVLFKDYPCGNQWHCIKGHVRLNDPGSANCLEEFWLDGKLEAQRTGPNHIGDYVEYGLNQLVFDNYWNGGSPQQNILYRDNIVVSTQRIGCMDDPPPPPASITPTPPMLLP